jgi:rod shape-determining protein MreC
MARRGSSYRRKDSSIGLYVGIGAVFLLAAGGIFIARQQAIPALSGGFSAVSGAVGMVINAPINFVRNVGNNISANFAGANEVKRLRAENKALLEWRDSARAIAEKLDTYEKLNGIQSTNNAKMLTGRLVAETNGPFSKSAVVNLGTNQGVGTNWIAVNQYGLVGRVISVGKDSARILLLTDADSRIAIMGENSRGRAILIGDKTDAPFLEHLNIPALIKADERVLTSGDDGILPRGVAIGTAGIGPDGRWRVKLATNSGAVDYIKLIAPNYIPTPQEKTNGYVIGQGMAPTPTATGQIIGNNAQGQVLPLNTGSAGVPIAQTPEAIAQAQELRKLKAELENAKKIKTNVASSGASASIKSTNTNVVNEAKPAEPVKVKLNDTDASTTPSAKDSETKKSETSDKSE